MYIGFLVSGRIAMVFETREEAYKGFKAGLGLVGELVGNGNCKVKVLYKRDTFTDNRHHIGDIYYFNQKIEDRLEITKPDYFIMRYIKRNMEG